MTASNGWPELETPGWLDTCRTLHLWSQLVGKTRLGMVPRMNHSWHVTLHVSAHGLTTLPLPQGGRSIEVELDLVRHRLEVRTSDGKAAGFALAPGTLAGFHKQYMDALASVGLHPKLYPIAAEIPETIHLDSDRVERPYDPRWANAFFGALIRFEALFSRFRARYLGKASPVHFFWGSFDLAVTRFSGRHAPTYTGHAPHCPDAVMREAYSHEVSSAGFWPGGPSHPHPMLYSYAYPSPQGFAEARIQPAAASWNAELGEFVLPYAAVRAAPDPEAAVMEFLESTYVAAADLGRWPRAELEFTA
jgi:hypothetical protein